MAEAEVGPMTSEPADDEAKGEEPTPTDPPASSKPEAPSSPPADSTRTDEDSTAAAEQPLGPTGDEPATAASDTPPTPVLRAETAAAASAESPVDLSGKWQLTRSENFEEFLRDAGVGLMRRKLITSFHPTMEVKQEGQEFTFTTKMPMGTRVTSFTVGVEYLERNPMWGDKENRVIPEWQGAKLVQRVVCAADEDVPRSSEREIVNEELVLTMQRGDKFCKRIFKKITA